MTRFDVAILAATEALLTFVSACFGAAYVQEPNIEILMWLCISTGVYVIARLEGSGYRTWGETVTADPEMTHVQTSNVRGVSAAPAPEEPEVVELRDEDVLDGQLFPDGAGEGV